MLLFGLSFGVALIPRNITNWRIFASDIWTPILAKTSKIKRSITIRLSASVGILLPSSLSDLEN
jgi:hypothetical protein